MSLYNVIVKITDDNYGCIYMHADNAEEACERTLALYAKWGMRVEIYAARDVSF